MRKLVLLLSGGLLLLATGCQTVSYTTNRTGGGNRIEQNAPFFLWGLAGEKVVDMDALCPNGPARWYSQQTFLDGFLSTITLGLYSPRTIVIECAAGGTSQLQHEGPHQLRISAADQLNPRG